MKPTFVLLHLLKTAAENGVSLGPAILPPHKPVAPVAPQPQPVKPASPMLPSPSAYLKAPAAQPWEPNRDVRRQQYDQIYGHGTGFGRPVAPENVTPFRPGRPRTEWEQMTTATNPGQALADRWRARDAQMARGVAVNAPQPSDLTTAQLLAPPSAPAPSEAVTQYNHKLRLPEEPEWTMAVGPRRNPQVASR